MRGKLGYFPGVNSTTGKLHSHFFREFVFEKIKIAPLIQQEYFKETQEVRNYIIRDG